MKLLINLAWSNLWYNKKRTILQFLLILITLAALILYKGYIDYSKEGMALGFIEKSGHLQIKSKNSEYLSPKDLNKLFSNLSKKTEVNKLEAVLKFSGIIGNENTSTIFWGEAYDNPDKKYGVCEGIPVFPNSENLVLGKVLADNLGINSPDEYVNILTNSPNSGMSLSSFSVSGFTDTGIPENDAGLVIASRQTIIDFLGEENIASHIQVFLKKNKDLQCFESAIKEEFPEYEIKNWIELNPSYNQVNSMNEMQYKVVSIIMCILVFVSLTQSLSTAFNERLYEFGMLESIGLKKIKISLMLYMEVLFLVIFGVILGLIFSEITNLFIRACNIEFIPPGYSSGFKLNFYITKLNILSSIAFIFVTCFLALLIPIKNVSRNTVVNLMNRPE
ncbi:MAG: FtsX-like permease family protein [Treponema sp.]|nr:FtsX-like permease family protein [Treponema sp.]